MLWTVWQDSRFSGGTLDSIAMSRSTDGGRSWSAPRAINRVATAAAFTPVAHVRADGVVAVLHYDLRNNTADAATLPADSWLLTSRDGITWAEAHVAGPFELSLAPQAGGALFLGDYQGLVSTAGAFVPVLVTTGNSADNRTDVFAPRLEGITAALGLHVSRAAPAAVQAQAQERRLSAVAENEAIARAMERRVPGWRARVQAAPGPGAAPQHR